MFDSLLIEFSVFLLILKISFCILERSLYQMCVLQIFSPVSYLLIPLIVCVFCRAKVLNFSWKQWYMTAILALGILRQEDDDFEASLCYG